MSIFRSIAAAAQARAREADARADAARLDVRAREQALQRGQMQIEAAARVLGQSGSYRAADRTRTTPGARGMDASPDAHLDGPTARDLRREAQDARRNSPIARAIVKRLADLAVQDGFGFEINSSDSAYNERAADLLREHELLHADFRQRQTLAGIHRELIANACFDGGTLVVVLDDGSLQLVEIARVANPGNGADTQRLVGGVEIDEAGRDVAYHVGQWSVGGTYLQAGHKRVSATAARLMTSPLNTTTGGTLPEPAIQAALGHIRHVEDVVEATVVAARVAACFGAAIETPAPDAMKDALEAAETQPARSNANQPKEFKLKPGTVWFAPPGTALKQLAPQHPGQRFGELVDTMLMLAAADLGVPLVLSHLKAGDANFHAFKSMVAISFLGFLTWQDWLARLDLRAKIQRLSYLIRTDALPLVEGWDRVELVHPAPPVIDLDVEIRALAEGVRQNFLTKRAAAQRLGFPAWSRTVVERGDEAEMERLLGVAVADMPGAAPPPPPPPPSPPESPEAAGGTENRTNPAAEGGSEERS